VSAHSLNSVATDDTKGSVITSASRSVHLDSGARTFMVTPDYRFRDTEPLSSKRRFLGRGKHCAPG
jgi:hypothetical protein